MLELYLSYAKEDELFMREILRGLSPFRQSHNFTTWHIGDALPGSDYQKFMAERIRKANIFIPICSANFFDTDRCLAEMNAAWSLFKYIITINYRSSALKYYELINANKVLPGQSPDKAFMIQKNKDYILLKMIEEIIKSIEEMQTL